MSRDAKVGLVIVFTFVFLLGTILVHRFHSTTPESPAGKHAAVAVSEDASASGDGFDADDLSSPSNSGRTTTVEAVSSEPISPVGSTGRVTPPLQPVLPGAPLPKNTHSANEPMGDVTAANDSGAHITLTDPQAERSRAAVVEPAPAQREFPEPNSVPERVTNFDAPGHRPSSPGRSVPLLEIPKRSRDAADMAIEASSQTVVSDPPATAEAGNQADTPVVEPTQEIPRMPNEQQQQHDLKPPEKNGIEEQPGQLPESIDSSRSDEPVRGNRDRRNPRGETTPPRLPQFSDPEQPTIESVPAREPAGASEKQNQDMQTGDMSPRGTPTPSRSDGSEGNQPSSQKTYVVKEGDSFWSISAKQYGSGKYFRALEEYNLERLPKYEDGQRILRPGTVIVLPELAMLRSRNSTSKPAEKSPAAKSKTDPWREDRSQDRSTKEDFRSSPRREPGSLATSTPGTYRVQEGDTLSTIAQRELGSAKRWHEIYQLNRTKLPDQNSLKLGMELKMPPADAAEKPTGRPNF